ncbi:MAG: leucine-rich repeat domain-containing protein, partial [Oscillospiraceae bacterium]|nr:leucine-rich repeat domain-containing protein [Oscillospiraceae bacterium]
MKKLKVLLSSITALSCFCVSCLPIIKQISPMYSIVANAEEVVTSGTCGENLTWNFEESTGTLTISGTGAMKNWNNEQESCWYGLHENIKEVIIEDGVTTIGKGAFSYCDSLTSVAIPDSVTAIGDEAFFDCSILDSIVIPGSVKSIGRKALSGTSWLQIKRNENPLVIMNGILIDGTTCEQEVIIPDSVISIADGAFCNCHNLKSIVIPDGITII